MSGTGETTANFAGEEREFCIRLGEIRRIESKCETGIGEVLRRLSRCVLVTTQLTGIEALTAGIDIHADDVRETIYQGLRGHGMPDGDATKLVKLEIDERGIQGLMDNASTALTVLWGSQKTPDTGEPEADPPGEPQAGPSATTPPSPSTSTTSMESAPPLG